MAGVPLESDVRTLLGLLECGLSGQNSQPAHQQLKLYESNPSFCSLLSFVFAASNPPPYVSAISFPWISFREIAGLTLKNNVSKAAAQLGQKSVAEIARCAANELYQEAGLPEACRVAHVAAQLVACVTSVAGISFWSEFVGVDLATFLLSDLAGSNNAARVRIGLTSLQYLFEDCPSKIGESSEVIIRTVTSIASEGRDDSIRSAALNMVIQSFEVGSEMDWNVDNLMPIQIGLCNACFTAAVWATQLASSDLGQRDPSTMKRALILFQHMLEYLEYLVSPVNNATVVEQMLQWWIGCAVGIIVRQENADLASSACDLLAHIGTLFERCAGDGAISIVASYVRQHIATLIPALFPCMLMKREEEVAILEFDHVSIRDVRMTTSIRRSGGAAFDDDADVGDVMASLRESSARCLEKVTKISDDVFAPFAEIVSTKLRESDWREQEVALLALGAVADCYIMQLAPHLPDLLPRILAVIRSQSHALLSSIALWALHRFTNWILTSAPQMLPDCTNTALLCLDVDRISSKRVHWAAITFLKELASACLTIGIRDFLDHINFIVAMIHRCLNVFHTNNFALLCDLSLGIVSMLPDENSVMAFASAFELNMQTKFTELMKTITERYVHGNMQQLVHKEVFDISRVVAEAYRIVNSQQTSSKAIEMLKSWVGFLGNALQLDAPDDCELVHYPLDIAGRFVLALDTASMQQVHAPLIIAVLKCLELPNPEIRATACEILCHVISILKEQAVPSLQQVLVALLPCLLTTSVDGAPVEASLVLLGLFKAFGPVPEIQRTASLVAKQIRTDTFGSTLMPSLATSVGAMLRVSPHFVSDEQLANICTVLAGSQNTEDKGDATIGVMQAFATALSGPQSASAVLPSLLRLTYSWQVVQPEFGEVKAAISSALVFAKMHVGDVLARELGRLPDRFRQQVIEQYGL